MPRLPAYRKGQRFASFRHEDAPTPAPLEAQAYAPPSDAAVAPERDMDSPPNEALLGEAVVVTNAAPALPALPQAPAAPSNEELVKRAIASLAPSTVPSEPQGEEGGFVVYDYKPKKPKPPVKRTQLSVSSTLGLAFMPADVGSSAYNASARISFLSGGLGGPTDSGAIDFIASADPSEIAYSEDGVIHLRRNLNGENGSVAGLFDSQNGMRTRMDIPLAKDEDIAVEVPLMNRSAFYSFLDQSQLTDYGGFILVDMADESIEDVDIDMGYRKKVCLDDQLESVDLGKTCRFTLFLFVSPGNATLSYATVHGEAVKTIHVYPDEVFFEAPLVSEAHTRSFGIWEQPLLVEEQLPMTLHGEHVRYLGLSEPSFMEAHGLYRVSVPPTLRATRDYLSVETPHGEFIAGGRDEVTVPGEKRFDVYQDYLGIEESEGTCVAQLEFDKAPLEVSVNSSSARGPMDFYDYYMASDGNIYDSFGDFTKTMFLVSDEQGVFNLKAVYEDGSVDYLQTFCNRSLYIVENL